MAAMTAQPPVFAGPGKDKGKRREVDEQQALLSLAERLRTWRAHQLETASQASTSRVVRVSDEDLIRDAILILQGVNGAQVYFVDHGVQPESHRGHFTLQAPSTEDQSHTAGHLAFVESPGTAIVPRPTRLHLARLGEIGWLYAQIRKCIHAKVRDRDSGSIELALCHCLQEQLGVYDAFVASLEACRTTVSPYQFESSPPGASVLQYPSELELYEKGDKLTLRQILSRVDSQRLQLRIMAVLADACGKIGNRGGRLLSLLHSYTSHGDPVIASFSADMLEEVSKPFFRFLSAWIYDGELRDVNQEFFVELASADRSDETNADCQTWSGQYRMREQMVPSFLSKSFAGKIFSTGRSLNYLKYACADDAWVNEQQAVSSHGTSTLLQYKDMLALERTIEVAHSKASRRMFAIFFDKFKFKEHLHALKDYMLLGKGDFFEILIDSLGPSLSKPASTLYRHHLTTTLDTAIRGSTAAHDDADVLSSLDARMIEYSHGDIGWDVFTLEYKVGAPVNVILDHRSMQLYSKLFSYLWRVKRVEYELSQAWRRITTEWKYYQRLTGLQPTFHRARLALSEMIHFVRQLQYFCHLEVIGCSWASLAEFLQKEEGDLDALVDAHSAYIDRIAAKALLKAQNRRGEKDGEDSIMHVVREALRTALTFKSSLDALCNIALAEASKLDERHTDLKALPTSAAARPGTSNSNRSATPSSYVRPATPAASYSPSPDPEQTYAVQEQLRSSAAHFQETAQMAVTMLAMQSDADFKVLSCRLNFSLFYLVGKHR